MALWKDVKGYEGLYLVSDEGDILSLPRVVENRNGKYIRKQRILKKALVGKGIQYYGVVLCRDGECISKRVHRLVAEAFCDNPNGYDTINHIDHDTLNNRVDNLEWCNQQYNNEYSHNKSIKQYTMAGEWIAEYPSITQAHKVTGISRTAINNALTGYSMTAGGYVWNYAEEERSDDLSH